MSMRRPLHFGEFSFDTSSSEVELEVCLDDEIKLRTHLNILKIPYTSVFLYNLKHVDFCVYKLRSADIIGFLIITRRNRVQNRIEW